MISRSLVLNLGYACPVRVVGTDVSRACLLVHGGPGVALPEDTFRSLARAVGDAMLVYPLQRALVAGPPWSTAQDIADLEAVRATLGVRRWRVVCGRSWGASLAVLYARRHPDRLDHLLALSPSSLRTTGADYHRMSADAYEQLHPCGPHSVAECAWRANVQLEYRRNDFFHDGTPLFAGVTTDTLVLYGDADESLDATDRALARRQHAVRVVPRHGHDTHPQLERWMRDQLRAWLFKKNTY